MKVNWRGNGITTDPAERARWRKPEKAKLHGNADVVAGAAISFVTFNEGSQAAIRRSHELSIKMQNPRRECILVRKIPTRIARNTPGCAAGLQ